MLTLLTTHRRAIEQRARELLLAHSPLKPSAAELQDGISLLIDQLVQTLRAGRSTVPDAEIERVAAEYSRRLFALGFTVSEVVHAYGAVCEALTGYGQEQSVRFTMQDFALLNRLLDVAIAGGMTEYERQRGDEAASREVEHLGVLAHELRNALTAAAAGFAVIQRGTVGIGGRTSDVVERNLRRMGQILDRALAEVRLQTDAAPLPERLRLADVLDQIAAMLQREAEQRKETLEIIVGDGLEIETDRHLLTSAVSNLLQNALKYTHEHGRVVVRGELRDGHVAIAVEDECGGLPDGKADELFRPFVRGTTSYDGIGLGLSIVQRAARTLGGALRVRDLPGRGCVFTLELPRVLQASRARAG